MRRPFVKRVLDALDSAGVESVLTLAFVAQFAFHAVPVPFLGVISTALDDEDHAIATGTVVQMPAKPHGPRTAKTVVIRDAKTATRSGGMATKTARVRRPDLADEHTTEIDVESVRQVESSVRITIIGPDGEPRTKIVRVSGSRHGVAAPARRPHD